MNRWITNRFPAGTRGLTQSSNRSVGTRVQLLWIYGDANKTIIWCLSQGAARVTRFSASRLSHVEINVCVMPIYSLEIVCVVVRTLLLFTLRKIEPKGHRMKYNLLKTGNNID